MVFGWFHRGRRDPMLPEQSDLDTLMAGLGGYEEVRDCPTLGLVNYIARLDTLSDTPRTNLSFFRTESSGKHFWKCAMVHGWSDAAPGPAGQQRLETAAMTRTLTRASHPRGGKLRTQFGGEPSGFLLDFSDGDVDYRWVFELKPYGWRPQIDAMVKAWHKQIPALDRSLRQIWSE